MLFFVIALFGFTNASGQNPVAQFTNTQATGCAPLAVTFTDQSTGNPTSWSWEFSNGTLSNIKNPTVSFSVPGTYSAKLVVQNASGVAQIEKIDLITVYAAPFASFLADITLSCIPANVKFTDLSSTAVGNITNWQWDFGDGATSTEQNPTHTYNNTGFYSVTLTVTASTGCKQVITRGSYIRVVGAVSTDFNFMQPVSCREPFTINFQNQSNGPGTITYAWNFGNGQTSNTVNPSTVYNATGTYTVTLSSQSSLGCTGAITKTISLTGTTTDFTPPATICLNQPNTFQNSSSAAPNSSLWTFGDGTTSAQINPVKTFLLPGVYNVKLVNQYAACKDSITKTITINAKPAVNFRADDSASCKAPFTVQFTDLTPGAASWQWDFGDGATATTQNPSHTYNAIGDYDVILTASTTTGCSNTNTIPAFIKISETTLGLNLPDGGCAPFNYVPFALINTVDSIATYLWDFGDGTTSNVRNPGAHLYPNVGDYNVSLTVTTVSGCTKNISIANGIKVGTPLTPDFTFAPATACAKDFITFAGTYTGVATANSEILWEWNFDDGTLGQGQNIPHRFAAVGMRNVILTLSQNRCSRSVTHPVVINPPIAKFTYVVDCPNNSIRFTNTSDVAPLAATTTYLWDFGVYGTSNQPTPPDLAYTGTAPITVKLTVANALCSYDSTRIITLTNFAPAFSISKNPVCKNEVFTLTATNIDPNIKAYQWYIDGILLAKTGRIIQTSIPIAGPHNINLTITDLNDCQTSSPNTQLIVNGPTALFIPAAPGGCLNKTINFTDQSTPANTITTWTFDFGDGSPAIPLSTPPFSHQYNQTGGYMVSLSVKDPAGCSDTYTLPTALLVSNPKAGFRADTFYCPVSPLQFVDTSSGTGLQYQWQFGDGGVAAIQNPTHSYALGDAFYSVKLRVADANGCVDSVTKASYIKIRSPKSAFSIRDTTTICPPLRTSFTFQGSDYQTYYWAFGDGGISTLQNPSYFYGGYGTYIPKLYTIGPGGCIDSSQSSVTVHDPADVQINYGPVTTACNSLNVNFNLVLPKGFRFIFYFGDGALDSTRSTTLTHFYPRPSFSTPYVVLYDSVFGCQTVIQGRTRIDVLGAIPLFSMDKSEICDNGAIAFTDFTIKNEPIINTLWEFGDGTTSNATSPVHNFAQPGVFITKLNITTQSNCTSSYSDTVLVYRTPLPSIQSRDTICLGAAEPFNGSIAAPDTLTEWKWDFGNGETSIEQNSNITYTKVGDYKVQLTTTNKIGCSSSITKNVYVVPPPTATPYMDPITIISGGNTPLLMNYSGNITSYVWSPNYRLTCNTCLTPIANPQFTTNYKIDIQDIYGCTNTAKVTVNVVCNNQNFFVPNTFSPNGDGQNEVFYPRGKGLFRIKSMTVFNRWGQVVFANKEFTVNDPAQGWNGTFKGQKSSADVYIYIIEILCDNNTLIPLKGNVTLLR